MFFLFWPIPGKKILESDRINGDNNLINLNCKLFLRMAICTQFQLSFTLWRQSQTDFVDLKLKKELV